MSCEISIDELDRTTPALSEGNNNPQADNCLLNCNRDNKKYSETNSNYNLKSIVSWCLNIVAYLTRLIYFKRLKILKFYMAIFVLFVVLLIILRHGTTETTSTNVHGSLTVGSESEPVVDSQHDDKLNGDKILQDLNRSNQHADQQALQDNNSSDNKQENHNVISPPPFVYPSNVTFSLNIKDFSRVNMNVMQVRIRDAMKHSWDSYRKYAWGFDMLKPRSMQPDHWFDLGLTIVDSADTLIIMGLEHEAYAAIEWIENELKFDSQNENSNCFELTIRILGGILTAQHLTRHEKLKQQAIKMGDILLHCYETKSKVIPYSDIDLGTKKAHSPNWNPYSSISEVASLQIEFRYLSQLSKNPIYEATTFQTNIHLHNLVSARKHKLIPMYIHPSTGELSDNLITLGARTDSYYEYLLKQYLQTGIKWLETDYLDSVDEIERDLLRHTNGIHNYTYVAEMQIYKTANDTDDIRYNNKMDHLVCFLPGTLALGWYHFSPEAAERRLKYNLETPSNKINNRYSKHLRMAKDLARTCYHMYSQMGTGLSPEIATFVHSTNSDTVIAESQMELQVQSNSAHNILRPEFIESIFYLYHITGLSKYREEGRQVFDSFEKYCKIPSGYTPISDVRLKPNSASEISELLHKGAPDRMESFWLGETLKYFYLLFADDQHIIGILLNNYVFNTEGHIVPILSR